jgi:hypothetical protein
MNQISPLANALPTHMCGMQFFNPDHPIDNMAAALYALRRPHGQHSIRRLVREVRRCHYIEIAWTSNVCSTETSDIQRWRVSADVSWDLCNSGYAIPAISKQDHDQTMKLSSRGEAALERGLKILKNAAHRELPANGRTFKFQGFGLLGASRAKVCPALARQIGRLYAYFQDTCAEDALRRYAILPDGRVAFTFRLGGD